MKQLIAAMTASGLALWIGWAAAPAPPAPLFGANVHPWADFNGSVAYVSATPGMGIVRWDEQVPGSKYADVVARYDYVTAHHLAADIVLVQPCCNYNLTFSYVRALALAMGSSRTPIVEITNEPNAVGFGNPWPAATYAQALYSARNGLEQSGLSNLRLSMGGLALNDQAYLSASGIPGSGAWLTDYGNAHLYTSGGSPHVGPLAPDDPDVAHSGYFGFLTGIRQMRQAVGKPLIVGEWGWDTTMPEYERAAYMRAVVSIARAEGVYALIVEEIGAGDGPMVDLRDTASWGAFAQAADHRSHD